MQKITKSFSEKLNSGLIKVFRIRQDTDYREMTKLNNIMINFSYSLT